jgi:biopolymer transport protein ExbD
MARGRSTLKSDPNLTPILDMVFQLITFFVLVVNFKSVELDLTLNLPVVGSARPATPSTNRLLVLNIEDDKQHDAALKVMGALYLKEKIKPYLDMESKIALTAASMTFDDVKDGSRELPDLIVIRADQKCPFGHVNYVIDACQQVGFRKFILKTAPASQAHKPQ